MSGGDRPLPTPPRSRFGGARQGQDATAPLTADRMAQAAAAGHLEEFLQQEIPEGNHARSLAMMMMGLSGMSPAEAPAEQPPDADQGPPVAEGAPSPDVLRAVGQGDVAALTCLLRAEHEKRNPGAAPGGDAPASPEPPSGADPVPPAPARPGIDATLIDELIRIAADTDVTIDWLMLRAVRLYVEEYRRTGRL